MTISTQKQKQATVYILLFIVALSLACYEAVLGIVNSWGQEEYSHGFFIPVITLILLLNRMGERPISPRNSWAGFVVLALCLVVHGLFLMAGVRGILPEIYLIALLSTVATFWGMKAVMAWAGALGFLMFSAPLPNYFYYTISFNMQLLSTSLGTHLLELMNVPVFRDGNIIDLGGHKLEVAEACSGIRYLFPLVSLSYLFAYLYRTSFVKRAFLFLSAIPITIFMNGLRIAIIGVSVDHWGSLLIDGPMHEFEGLLVFIGCALCLMLEVWLLQKIGKKGEMDFSRIGMPRLSYFVAPVMQGAGKAASILVALALLAGMAVPAFFHSSINAVPLKQSFLQFPLRLGEWVGRSGVVDALSLSKLGTEDYLLADYVKPGAPPVNLYVLYYPLQDSSSNQAVHSPTVCIPAGGWGIDAATTTPIAERFAVNKVVISKNNERQLVYYWFNQNGRSTVSPYLSRLYSLQSAMTEGRTNGAMIRIVTKIDHGESEAEAEARLKAFLAEGLPTLNDFMFSGK